MNLIKTAKLSKTCLTGITLSLVAACSSIPNNPETNISSQIAPVQTEKNTINRSSELNQGRPLWIWIAPEYRKDLPEGTGEYLIESI